MKRLIQFVKDWMLPLAIVTGIVSYLIYHWCPVLRPIGPAMHVLAVKGQPITIIIMLFLQFVKVSPADLKLHKWHMWMVLFQSLSFVGLGFLTLIVKDLNTRILIECAMLCFICPTASAAGVITDKLGGILSATITYVVLINFVASILIPLMFPIIAPSADFSFVRSFMKILLKVFSILILPCALAWTIRYTMPRLQEKLTHYTSWAFYIWGFSLILAIVLATRALVLSHISFLMVLAIAVVSFGCCVFQFWLGRRLAKSYGPRESLTAGQALGQKNTGFLIWLGYSFLTPVTSVAGGLYAVWHNIVNSWELYQKRKSE